jgi:hypothetical protein
LAEFLLEHDGWPALLRIQSLREGTQTAPSGGGGTERESESVQQMYETL